MKASALPLRIQETRIIGIAVAILLSIAVLAAPNFGQNRITVTPPETGDALTNPGMGWVFYYYDDDLRQFGAGLDPNDTVDYFPGVSVVYFRVPWSFVEPSEGKFNWNLIDSVAQRWISKHKRIALRFTSTESSWPAPVFATPKWVMDAGAKGHFFRNEAETSSQEGFWEPDYDDKVYLQKLDNFLGVVGERYGDNSDVAFVDVGSFGVWGEGHTLWSTKIPYSASTIERIIDLYCKHFKHTLLAANDDFAMQGRGESVIDYAKSKGLTLRDDSILVHGGDDAYLSAALAAKFWQHSPTILETQYYRIARKTGTWKDGGKLLSAVEDYHASYVAIQGEPKEVLRDNGDLISKINQRLGYRLKINEVSWPESADLNSSFAIEYEVSNVGVAPCLPGGHVTFTIKDRNGGIVGEFVDDSFDVRTLDTGRDGAQHAGRHHVVANFALPDPLHGRSLIGSGSYDVFVSVGTLPGTPVLQLPLLNSDGQNRYKLGIIRLTATNRIRALSPPE
jgi:hypothetical protein